MPRLLIDRLRHDSIREFLDAAVKRNDEANCLYMAEHAAGAIYLWGYVAEMIVKAAWFRLIGKAIDDPITIAELTNAKHIAMTMYSITWSGNLHHLHNWSQLLTMHRMTLGKPYASIAFSARVVESTTLVYDRWREFLRYKSNRPYGHEANIVRNSVSWLLDHRHQL